MQIKLKRIYEPASEADGLRVLVDRLWPRGIKKEDAAIDLWCKDVAPSAELRRWFGHVPERFAEFEHRYREELQQGDGYKELVAKISGHDVVTLLYSAKDHEHNNAVVLAEMLGGE